METVGFSRLVETPLILEIVGVSGVVGGNLNVASTPVDALLVPISLIALIWNV